MAYTLAQSQSATKLRISQEPPLHPERDRLQTKLEEQHHSSNHRRRDSAFQEEYFAARDKRDTQREKRDKSLREL